MNPFEFVFVPMILFLVIVAPIWLVLHYRYKSRMSQGISEQELGEIEAMLETVDKLTERIETLEEILDSEHKDWRMRKPGKSNGDQR